MKKNIIFLMILLLSGVACSTPDNSISKQSANSTNSINNSNSISVLDSVVSKNESTITNYYSSNSSIIDNSTTTGEHINSSLVSSNDETGGKYDVNSEFKNSDGFTWGSMIWPDSK